jgi:hypothetical protein
MNNNKSSHFRSFFKFHNILFLSLFLSVSALSLSYLTGCSAGPAGPGASSGTERTTIYGRVVDESGIMVAGANVTAGASYAVSDINGYFIIKDAEVPKGRAVVLAKKSGFYTSAHAEVPGAKGSTRMDLHMMSDASNATVSASTGGLVNVAGGGTVSFTAGSFTDASGAAYSGSVKVSARYLDPKNSNFFDYFSGDGFAQTADGNGAHLISSGVIRVELKDANGAALKLDPSKPATLSFPKPLDTKAPATMPLWYFDESLGMWKEDGSATLSGNNYVGTVTHFTDFNLDYIDSSGGFNTSGSVDLRIVCNGAPVGGVAVSIVGDDNPSGKYFVHPGAKTGNDGRLHLYRFPANRPTEIIVRADKNNGLYFTNSSKSVTISPGQSLDIGDLSLDSPCPATIKGTLTACDDSKAEGLVTVTDGTHLSYIYTKTGDFAVQAPGLLPLTIDAMDANGNQATTLTVPALASSELRDIGSIKICGTATANYIDIPLAAQKENQLMAFSPDGSRLALWMQPSQFNIYDTKTGNIVSTATVAGNSYFSGLQFSSDNAKLLLSTPYGSTMLYDVSGATASLIISIPSILNAKLYDDGSKIIAAVSQSFPNPQLVKVFSTSDGSVVQTLHPTNLGTNGDSTGTLGFIQDENTIVYPDMSSTGTAHVWGVAGDAEVRNFPFSGNSYLFISSDDGLAVASSNDYITFYVYDTKTGTKTDLNLQPSGSQRYSVPILTKGFAYTPDQVSGTDIVRITKISDGTSTTKLFLGASHISRVAASRNEQYLAAVNNTTIRIWKLK